MKEATFDETRHFMETVHSSVCLRLDRGDHPGDCMMMAKEMLDAWVAANVDGAYPDAKSSTS